MKIGHRTKVPRFVLNTFEERIIIFSTHRSQAFQIQGFPRFIGWFPSIFGGFPYFFGTLPQCFGRFPEFYIISRVFIFIFFDVWWICGLPIFFGFHLVRSVAKLFADKICNHCFVYGIESIAANHFKKFYHSSLLAKRIFLLVCHHQSSCFAREAPSWTKSSMLHASSSRELRWQCARSPM